MKKEDVIIRSRHLSKDMTVTIYGHFGPILLMFPPSGDNCHENEEKGMLEIASGYIDSGRCKIYSVETVNKESWLNQELPPDQRSRRHFEFDKYIIEEVVPFIFEDNGTILPIITVGASIGGYHAANFYFKRPDIFIGTNIISGIFDLRRFTGGYFDENCYFNSPVDYLPNLNDNYWLSFLRSRDHVYISSGSGIDEHPEFSKGLSDILTHKAIPHHLEIKGSEWGHNCDSWKVMMHDYLIQKI